MKRTLGVFLMLSWFAGPQDAAADSIKVMTYNQYLGADFASLLEAPDFNEELVDVLRRIGASDFPARAQRQAEQIARHLPDLVGLQEVWRLECIDLEPPTPGGGCDHPSIAGAFVDYLDETLDALDALMGNDAYEAVARVVNLDLELLLHIDEHEALLRVTDRDVILARDETVIDVEPVDFGLACRSSVDGCNYTVFLGPPFIPLNFERGFVAVDATVRGADGLLRDYRFVNTHLELREPDPGEPLSPFFQSAQAAELIGLLSVMTPPELRVIVVGDLNSSPDDEPAAGFIEPPYRQFVEAGYTDVWTLRPGVIPGFTCCQDEDLRNRRSALDERIDFIFSSEIPVRVRQARIVGTSVADKTPPPGLGLWPSDHGGVVAELHFGPGGSTGTQQVSGLAE